MRMETYVANDMRGINDHINANGIKKEQIVTIFQENDGLFVVTYYTE